MLQPSEARLHPAAGYRRPPRSTPMRFTLSLALLALLAAPALAQRAPTPRPLPARTSPAPAAFEWDARWQNALHAQSLRGAAIPVETIAPTVVTGVPALTADGSPATGRGAEPVRWLEGDLGAVPAGRGTLSDAVLAALVPYARRFGLREPATELRLVRAETDALGQQHVRYEQVYGGVPVWGRELTAHVAGGRLVVVNGATAALPAGLETRPALSPDDARRAADADHRADGRLRPLSPEMAALLGADRAAPRLVLYPDLLGARLAYEVESHASFEDRYRHLIDAQTGEVLRETRTTCTIHGGLPHGDPAAPSAQPGAAVRLGPVRADAPRGLLFTDAPTGAPAGASADGFVDATRPDLNGVSRTFRTYLQGATYTMLHGLDNYAAAGTSYTGGSLIYLPSGTTQAPLTAANNTSWDPASVSAAYNAQVTYDYFRRTFGRKAIDDANGTLRSIIHQTGPNGAPQDNAYWNGTFMSYGDGATVFKPLAGSLDVGGHEMSHGVIQRTANLDYELQQGALNESFADVFGVLVDTGNFLLGETIMQPGQGRALRNLENPDDPTVHAPQPAHFRDFRTLPNTPQGDNGGVHVNSGIPNRAAFLVIQALGRTKTEQIYYRGLSTYLGRQSQFVDARLGLARAAEDLYGAADRRAVEAAFDAVGVTGTASTPPPTTPPVLGVQLVALVTADGTLATFDPATQTYRAYAAARVRVNGDDRSQVSASRDGARLWFVNASRQLAFVELATGAVSALSVNLGQAGDLYNAAISPDEGLAVLTSAYTDDPAIYVTDGQQVGRVPVRTPTTEGGTGVAVAAVDALAWSPSTTAPAIGLDAFHVLPAGSGRSGYWSVYEYDLAQSRLAPMVASPPSGTSIGNVTYARTNPLQVALNTLDDATGTFDVAVLDFQANQGGRLNLPGRSLGGQPLRDGQRPTFSADDSRIYFVSPSLRALLYADAAGQVSGWQFPSAVYLPFAFVSGGTVANAGDPQGTAGLELRVGPNPARGTARVGFSLAQAGRVDLALFDGLGRRVATLAQGDKSGGAHEAALATEGLAPGVYFVRLAADGQTLARALTVAR